MDNIHVLLVTNRSFHIHLKQIVVRKSIILVFDFLFFFLDSFVYGDVASTITNLSRRKSDLKCLNSYFQILEMVSGKMLPGHLLPSHSCSPTTLASCIDAGVGASLSESGDVGVGEGET